MPSVYNTSIAVTFLVVTTASFSSPLNPQSFDQLHQYRSNLPIQSGTLTTFSQEAAIDIFNELASKVKDTPQEITETINEFFWDILA